jgi:hypothetical protein
MGVMLIHRPEFSHDIRVPNFYFRLTTACGIPRQPTP